jgi:hypothetical protein
MLKRLLVGSVLVGFVAVGLPAPADPPGGGDKQCIPGLNAQPHPAQKGGTCPGK